MLDGDGSCKSKAVQSYPKMHHFVNTLGFQNGDLQMLYGSASKDLNLGYGHFKLFNSRTTLKATNMSEELLFQPTVSLHC